MAHPAIALVLARPQYVQRSKEWYEVRKGLITASDAAGALGIPAYASQRNVRTSLLKQKVENTFVGNVMTRWGQDNEDPVRDRACAALGETCVDVGLLIHQTIPWLGASPDGLMSSGRLIEIKCPYKRKPVVGHVPEHYWVQVQCQLEVADVDACYFVQWQPAHLAPDDEEIFCIDVIERDRLWFKTHVDELKSFWKDLMDRRAAYVPPPPPGCDIQLGLYDAAAATEQQHVPPQQQPVPPQQQPVPPLDSSSSSDAGPTRKRGRHGRRVVVSSASESSANDASSASSASEGCRSPASRIRRAIKRAHNALDEMGEALDDIADTLAGES